MEKKIKAFTEGDSNFMSTNGALVTHAIWKEAIRSSDPSKAPRNEDEDEKKKREKHIHNMINREVKNVYEMA
jgi:hypothetical protein